MPFNAANFKLYHNEEYLGALNTALDQDIFVEAETENAARGVMLKLGRVRSAWKAQAPSFSNYEQGMENKFDFLTMEVGVRGGKWGVLVKFSEPKRLKIFNAESMEPIVT